MTASVSWTSVTFGDDVEGNRHCTENAKNLCKSGCVVDTCKVKRSPAPAMLTSAWRAAWRVFYSLLAKTPNVYDDVISHRSGC